MNVESKKCSKVLRGFLAVLVLGLACLLSGCGGKSDAEVLNIYNWGLYMDPQVLEDFTAETGIEVKYEEFPTNEDLSLIHI